MTMYLADRGQQAPIPERQPSPLTFSSNNPFRNRATSPSPQNSAGASSSPQTANPPTSASQQQNGNSVRMSKNPFLDASEITTSPVKKEGGLTEDIFKDLSLLDKPAGNGAPPPGGPPRRAPTLPPTGPLSGHRANISDERRGPPRPPRGPDSPSKRGDPRSGPQRPRGMSESSVIDERERRERRDRERGERPERTESEERRRRERRREREERHRREKEKIRNGDRKIKRPQGLDIIDKLDVTGIYGQGLFHHDGPFDACNPHRNAKKAGRPAPMQAFPEGSANMMLGGSGPLRSKIDLDKFHGRGEEGFADYAVTKKADTAIIDPRNAEQVHGDESYGLGTSTFLEGAPASKSALQRRDSEEVGNADNGMPKIGSGLTRKKSLAQRFRGMSASRGNRGPNDALRSPDARYNDMQPMDSPPRGTISAGGPAKARYTKENEVNPFDQSYDDAFEKKGAQIRIAEAEKEPMNAAPGASSSRFGNGNGLTRSMTADSAAIHDRGSSNEENKLQPPKEGFLSRMKSLKGGRRARPERRDT